MISDTPLGQQTLLSFNASVTEASKRNAIRQSVYYLTFAVYYGVDVLFPSIPDAANYNQFLANSLSAPGSRRNYISGAKKWILARGGDDSALSSPEANAVYKGGLVTRPHTPNPAPALTPSDLILLCTYLDTIPHSSPVKAALCLGYFSFLRASNLLSPSITLWSGPHTLTRGDIILHEAGLTVVIRSSKTIRLNSQPVPLSLPLIPGSPACPTAAWYRYTTELLAPPDSPAFLLFTGKPLTPSIFNQAIRDSLVALGCPYGSRFSGHSLRRGGSQAAVAGGADRLDVSKHGTWSTPGGMKPYVPSPQSTRVAQTLATLFAS